MKRILSLTVLTALAIFVVACGGGNSNGLPRIELGNEPSVNDREEHNFIGVWETVDHDGVTWFFAFDEDGTGFFDSEPSTGSIMFTHRSNRRPPYLLNASIAGETVFVAQIIDGNLRWDSMVMTEFAIMPYYVRDYEYSTISSYTFRGSNIPAANPVTISQWIPGTWVTRRDGARYIFNADGTGEVRRLQLGGEYLVHAFTWSLDQDEFFPARITITSLEPSEELTHGFRSVEGNETRIFMGPAGNSMRIGRELQLFKEN